MQHEAQRLTGSGRPWTRFGERPRFREGLYRLGRATYAWMVPNGSWGETSRNLIAGLHHLLSLDADQFVPGHGPLASRADVQRVVDYWEFVHENVQSGGVRHSASHECYSTRTSSTPSS